MSIGIFKGNNELVVNRSLTGNGIEFDLLGSVISEESSGGRDLKCGGNDEECS